MNGNPQEIFENLLFPNVFKAFRISIQPTKLVIAFLALTLIFCTGWLMDLSNTVVTIESSSGIKTTELDVYLVKNKAVDKFRESYEEKGERSGVFSTLLTFAAENFHSSLKHLFAFNFSGVASNITQYFRAVAWAVKYHPFYCTIFFAVKFVVIAFAGGAICRMAALQFAQGEKPGFAESLNFGFKNFKDFFFAPLVPFLIIAALGLIIFVPGLLGNIPYLGEIIIGLQMPLALLAGSVMVLVTIGAFAGFILMFPAVAFEKCDCFDAISRAFNYLYTRPFRLISYSVIAAFFGSICYTFLRFFVYLLMYITRLFLSFAIFTESKSGVDKIEAIWPEPTFLRLIQPLSEGQLASTELAGAVLIRIALLIVVGLLVSVVISFFFSANSIIYSLLRFKVDNTGLEEVHTQLDETKDELNDQLMKNNKELKSIGEANKETDKDNKGREEKED